MIVVTGATGSIGRELVGLLRAGGAPLRAFVRSAAKGDALGCDYVVGDFDEPDTVAAALAGADRLFLNAGGAVPAEGAQPMVRQQVAAIDAARRAGVGLVVKVSVWGAKPGGKLAEGAHWEIERHLKASGLDWQILQPSGFMQNFRTGAGSFTDDGDLIGVHGDSPVSYIDCHDIAAVAAALLTGDEKPGQTLVLTGPEALTHAAVAAKLSAAAGREIRYRDLTPGEMADRLAAQGVPRSFVDDVVTLWAEVARGSLAGTTDTVRRLTGRPPRTFDQFLAAAG